MTYLYILQIGGQRAECLFEVHEVHLVLARDDAHMLEQCRGFARIGMSAAHVDGWARVPLRDTPLPPAVREDQRLYLVELGLNAGSFMEQHRYLFEWAATGREAMATARKAVPGWHVDTIVDVTQLAQERGWHVGEADAGDTSPLPIPVQTSRYIKLDLPTRSTPPLT